MGVLIDEISGPRVIEVTPRLLEDRRLTGADKHEEMWDGVLHLITPAKERHQDIETELLLVLLPLGKARGLKVRPEIGYYRRDDDYRQPDLAAYRRDQRSERGIEQQAELVIEVVSPKDESRRKIPWYITQGVQEVIVVLRDTLAVELYVPGEDGLPERVEPVRSEVLGCNFERIDDDHLLITTDDDGEHEIFID